MKYVKVKINGRPRIYFELCWECTGDGWMCGNVPCKVCRGKGIIKQVNNEVNSKKENSLHRI